jgi:hypothetical protein
LTAVKGSEIVCFKAGGEALAGPQRHFRPAICVERNGQTDPRQKVWLWKVLPFSICAKARPRRRKFKIEYWDLEEARLARQFDST